jgi:hypothetical protein
VTRNAHFQSNVGSTVDRGRDDQPRPLLGRRCRFVGGSAVAAAVISAGIANATGDDSLGAHFLTGGDFTSFADLGAGPGPGIGDRAVDVR